MAAATSASVPMRPSGMRASKRILHVLRQRIGHRRNDETRRNRVHGDISRSDFDGQRARQADQAGLRGDVIRLPRIARLRHHGSHVDDAAVPRAHHHGHAPAARTDARRSDSCAARRPSRPAFMRTARPSRVMAALFTRMSSLPNFSMRLPESGLHLLGVGDVHRHGQRFAAGRGDFGDDAGQFFRISRRRRHARARLRQRQRRGAPDSLRGAGHQRHSIFQAEHGDLVAQASACLRLTLPRRR